MRAFRAAMMAGVSALAIAASAALVSCATPAGNGYVICNEAGDDAGCATGNVAVMDSDNGE